MVTLSNQEMADRAWEKLLGYAKDGLPAVYKNIGEYLHDFYPDLPWDGPNGLIATNLLLEKPQEDFDRIQKAFDFDMRAELKEAVAFLEEG